VGQYGNRLSERLVIFGESDIEMEISKKGQHTFHFMYVAAAKALRAGLRVPFPFSVCRKRGKTQQAQQQRRQQ